MNRPVSLTHEMDATWRYASGAAMERFANNLRQRRTEAVKCGVCERRYLPPRPFCGICKSELTEWVPVADEGVLDAWTVVYLPIVDNRTGVTRDGPYGMGLIRLDGADTTLNHYLAATDTERLEVGQRVKAVWRDELQGAIDDILHFEVLK
ncbi:MAG: Zn-ribbon domain-containing OB-fold protein [Gammaproteobacteria bacterium]|nr:Zn-ribbon domain-containing OB-fold protein [Gammaproteobacteria bacterium]